MAAASLFDGCQVVKGGSIKIFFPDFGLFLFMDVEKFKSFGEGVI